MFNAVTITLKEAVELREMIDHLLKNVVFDNFKIVHRLNRQVKRLDTASSLFGEARKDALIEVLGEDFSSVLTERQTDHSSKNEQPADNAPSLKDLMSSDEWSRFNALFAPELDSDFQAELLKEDFEHLIGDVKMETDQAIIASDVLVFLGEKSFNLI
ncbi:MAG: hypothetical protein HRT70_05350 [Flavobacteriaceae bacterium]|nr:hypothetical protein [Flavobacteriaceae bacterium]